MRKMVEPSVVSTPLGRVVVSTARGLDRREGVINEARMPSSERAMTIDRILDWYDEARASGRMDRAHFLTCLAWEAFDRCERAFVPGGRAGEIAPLLGRLRDRDVRFEAIDASE